MIERIEQLSYEQFHERNTNEYSSWLTNDINLIEEQGFANFYRAISSATLLLLSAIAIFKFHWLLLAVSLVLSVLMMLIPKLFKQALEGNTARMSKSFEKYTATIDEWFKGFDTLYHYNHTQLLSQKLAGVIIGVKEEKQRLKKTQGMMYTAIRSSSVIAQYAIILVTGLMILAKKLSAGTIFAIGDLTGNFFGNTSFFIDEVTNFISALKISDKIDEALIYDEVTIKANQDYSFTRKITVTDVSYQFPEVTVKIPDMVFEKGKKYAIVGKSGSGKSTFLNILMKNYRDFTGVIQVDNQSLQRIDDDELKYHWAYVSQKATIFDLSLVANLTLEEDVDDDRLTKVMRDMILNEVSFDKQQALGVQGANISGGQAQRVELGRALLHTQDLLIIDEGTSGLDPKTAQLIEETILAEPDLTVIFVTHHLNSSLSHYFERIYSFSK
ncbi:ABC transporter ATP-binding protein [Vagococcus zengguangii]|uniref:ABC transporter ATP-binding protein n=1 Tax=Vagococcus zengguangii TaxID=2571750 RepID=A0A4D7CUS7_9ENTE|nr:ABC transporter ATP-binding protein [Vagococcus zengguangii]TLG80438.1 ABC transporter ATP-binding protein [Vagococcus zengguangii]